MKAVILVIEQGGGLIRLYIEAEIKSLKYMEVCAMKHKVKISVGKEPVLGSRIVRVPSRLLNFVLGDFSEVILLKPGYSVSSVEVHEIPERSRA